jgi:hypothetical protein
MKRFWLLLGLVLSPTSLFAQGAFIPPQTALKNINGIVMPIANATITVCAAGAGGIPCSPALVSTIFKDQGLTQPLSNPFTADANGNYQFAVSSTTATYTVTVTSAGFSGYSYQVTVGTVASASFAATAVTYSATPTFTATTSFQLFTMTLTGNVTSSTLTPWTLPSVVVFELTQDATGNRTFAWPSNVIGGAVIGNLANQKTVQEFLWDGSNAIALGPAIANP